MNQNNLIHLFSEQILQLTLNLKTNLLKKINILNQKFQLIVIILVKLLWSFYVFMLNFIKKLLILIIFMFIKINTSIKYSIKLIKNFF